jgi:putative glutamine amidotransferase
MPVPDAGVLGHCDLLERCGAQSVILHCNMDPVLVIEELDLHGIVFSGGGDVEASRYDGNAELANQGVNSLRDDFEFALMNLAFSRKLPVLAVCRGVQLANVVLGGTLIEDLPHHFGENYRIMHHQVREAGRSRDEYCHEANIVSGTQLYEILQSQTIEVNSLHHQAIRTLAPELRVAALAEDGTIEAVEFITDGSPLSEEEDPGHGFFIGVQWHPELLRGNGVSRRLYAYFVGACRNESSRSISTAGFALRSV